MITTLYAALLALLYIVLAAAVIRARYKYRVGIGDGGNEALARIVRVHGNFAEYVPFTLLLLFFVDDGGASPVLVHVLGGMLVAGRVLHAIGLGRAEGQSFGRLVGMVLTFAVILVCAALLLWRYFAAPLF